MRTFVWECLRLAEHQHGYGMASHGCYAGMQLYLNASYFKGVLGRVCPISLNHLCSTFLAARKCS